MGLASKSIHPPRAGAKTSGVTVLDRIRRLIEESGVGPGGKLPPERDMAAQLRVGRPAVREAIKALVSLDVLESRRGDGTYLRSAAPFEDAPSLRPSNAQPDLIELLELRKMIEPRAAALAAARATPQQVARIEKELRAQENNLEDLRAFAVHDYRFHHEILSAAGNRLLSRFEAFLAPLLRKSRELTIHTTPSLELVSRQHRAIFTAIRLGEPQFAERAMTEHLQTMGIDLISGMRR
jgi:DNA-binding FadR family transcriptional regulator